MKKEALAAALAAALALSACTPEDLSDNYDVACSRVSLVSVGYSSATTIAALAGYQIPASIGASVNKAIAAAQKICNGPRPANVEQAAAQVLQQVAAILSATDKVKVRKA